MSLDNTKTVTAGPSAQDLLQKASDEAQRPRRHLFRMVPYVGRHRMTPEEVAEAKAARRDSDATYEGRHARSN